jgi:hypothetical protein
LLFYCLSDRLVATKIRKSAFCHGKHKGIIIIIFATEVFKVSASDENRGKIAEKNK